MKRETLYYKAMRARDPRYDGKFFIGVKTTGIYCRPICPAKPKRENIEFFSNALEAERAGYRACLRCRPETAPGSPAWMGKSAVVHRAMKVLQKHPLEWSPSFADRFGLSARHLNRLFVEALGKTPKQFSYENRLHRANQLLSNTDLSIAEVAFTSGFHSIRRFNDAFKNYFKKSPSKLRSKR